jgi:limonene 1,2-monooxygenase
LRSYELMGRYVIPEFRGHLEPLRASYDMVVSKKGDYGAPAMAAIKKAYEDAGQQMPEDLNPTNLR